MSTDSMELFDLLRSREEDNYQVIQELLGESFSLIHTLLRLYELFIELSLEPICGLGDVNQIPALLHSLQWMKNEAIAGTITLLRGHITDSSNFSRRAIEICAFIVRMYEDKESAKRWMEAGKSKKARGKYETSFPAWKLVKESLPPELVQMYADDCLDVHPSFFAVAKRASLDADFVHRFGYFDLDETDEFQTFLVINFFNLCLCHGKIMDFLYTIFNPSGSFNSERWLIAYEMFVEEFKVYREVWRPVIDAYYSDEES